MWPSRSRPHTQARLAALTPTSSAPSAARNASNEALESPPAQRAPVMTESVGEEPRRGWHVAWDRRSQKAAAFLLACLLLLVVWWWVSGRPTDGAPVAVADVEVVEGVSVPGGAKADSSLPVVVHVIGKVAEPGIVELPPGSRVLDAIDAVGGALSDKALQTVNLARVVVDGEQILVGAAADSAADSKVSINRSDAATLEQLPGVGPVIAERIVQWRSENGPFGSIEELAEISGIGQSMIDRIREQVRM